MVFEAHIGAYVRGRVGLSPVYAVYDEGLEEKSTVLGLAVGLVDHSRFQGSPDGRGDCRGELEEKEAQGGAGGEGTLRQTCW